MKNKITPHYLYDGKDSPNPDEYMEIMTRIENHIPYITGIAYHPGFLFSYNILTRDWISDTRYKVSIKDGVHTFKIDLTMAIQILKFCNDVPDFVTEKERETNGDNN